MKARSMKDLPKNETYISESFLAAVVVFIALAIRVMHLVFTERLNPLAGDLTLDAAIYDRWAKALVWGGEPVTTTLMQAPLFPWFISIIYRMFGPSLLAVRAAHVLMGTMTCAFTVVVTRRLFRSSTAGIISGLMMALYLPAIFYEGVLVPATLILFLNSLFLLLMVPEKGSPQGVRLVLSGFVLGLSVIAKPVALLLAPFALFLILKGAPGRALARNAAVFTVGLLVAITPLTLRNARVTGEFIPLTTGGGINFYIGNNPKANGFYSVPFYAGKPIGGTPEVQQERMTAIAERESGRPLSGREVSSFWTRKGMDHIRRHPRRTAALLWQKTLFFWNSYERSNVESLAFHKRFGGVLPLRLPGFGLVAPLGLLGIFMTWKERRRLHLVYGGIIAYFAAGLVFYVLARYRLPVMVFLIPMAGAAIASMLKLFRDRKRGEFALMLAALLLLAHLVNMPVAVDTPALEAGNLVRLGRVHAKKGELSEARDAFDEALRVEPGNKAALDALRILDRHK